MIGTLLLFGGRQDLDQLRSPWPGVRSSGALLQFGVQARQAWTLTRHDLRFGMTEPVRQVVRNFMPVLVSRGAVQLTGYIDTMIASLLPTGAVTGLTNAQILYTLPVSLFGIAISASELPAMSGDAARRPRAGRPFDALSPPDRRARCSGWRSSSSLGGCLRRARRRDRRRAAADRTIHRDRLALRLGHPRRILDRPAGDDDGAAVFGGALRGR